MESEWVFHLESNRWFRSIHDHTGEPCWELDSFGGPLPHHIEDDQAANLISRGDRTSRTQIAPKGIYAHSTPFTPFQTHQASLSDLELQPTFEEGLYTDSEHIGFDPRSSDMEYAELSQLHCDGGIHPDTGLLAASSGSSPPDRLLPKVQYDGSGKSNDRDTGYSSMRGRSKTAKSPMRDTSMLQSHSNYSQESALEASYMASGSNSEHEILDPRYKKQKDPRAFFRVGRVFSMLWHENAGSNGRGHSRKASPRGSPQFTRGKYQEPIYSSIRRMVVVKQQKGCCWCVPITTYGGQGVAKAGIDRSKHAIIYMRGEMPPMNGDEPAISKQPLEVDPVKFEQKLDPMSRVNFGKVYTVEHNVKVLPVGEIKGASRDLFLEYFQSEFL